MVDLGGEGGARLDDAWGLAGPLQERHLELVCRAEIVVEGDHGVVAVELALPGADVVEGGSFKRVPRPDDHEGAVGFGGRPGGRDDDSRWATVPERAVLLRAGSTVEGVLLFAGDVEKFKAGAVPDDLLAGGGDEGGGRDRRILGQAGDGRAERDEVRGEAIAGCEADVLGRGGDAAERHGVGARRGTGARAKEESRLRNGFSRLEWKVGKRPSRLAGRPRVNVTGEITLVMVKGPR